MVGRETDMDIDWQAGADEIADQVNRQAALANIDNATAKLIDSVRLIEAWVDDHPEHDEIRQWTREILVSALYIENEYAYKSGELRQSEQTTSNLLSRGSATGQSSRNHRKQVKQVKDIIDEITDEQGEGAAMERLIEKAAEEDIGKPELEHSMEKLQRQGEVYEHPDDHYRTT